MMPAALANVGLDVPLRLAAAADLAFPDGSMTASGLRRERDAGRLETWTMAGKEYTSLAAIEEMVRQCRARPKAPACGSSPRASAQPVSLTPPSGSSATESESIALAAALLRCQPQKMPSVGTLSKSTILRLQPKPSPTTR